MRVRSLLLAHLPRSLLSPGMPALTLGKQSAHYLKLHFILPRKDDSASTFSLARINFSLYLPKHDRFVTVFSLYL